MEQTDGHTTYYIWKFIKFQKGKKCEEFKNSFRTKSQLENSLGAIHVSKQLILRLIF